MPGQTELTLTLQAYDFAAGAWVTLDGITIGTGEVYRSTTVSTGAARFVSGARQAWLRLQTSRASGSYNASYEQVRLTVTP